MGRVRRDRVRVTVAGRRRAAALRRLGVRDLVVDVDGCMTDGRLVVNGLGEKAWKAFGPDDSDALKAAQAAHLRVTLVTADEQGSLIVRHRAEHMGVPLVVAPGAARVPWLVEHHDVDSTRTVYIGDGWHDADNVREVAFGVAPADAWPWTIRCADAVTSRPGGHRAVAQAVDYVLRRIM
jgi:3-deoxy-D-manno-octulosonate 8-phosphate phosphatase (KDO 8-P phosphatase)